MKSVLVAFGLLLGGFAHAHGGHDHNNPSMTHLTFADGAIHAHATWETGPLLAEESVLRIEWKNGADHSPTEPGGFKVVLWMPA
ncbi:MAG TPA: hypothetical protein PL182_08905, partial [Pseudobdellovibrionaceae bacterium]|nr:hypothetical protein [Pseudobdellovibrionaceae bacterium]